MVRLEEERTALDGLRAAVREARKVREEKRAALDAALEEERRARQALSDLRTRIGRLGTMLHIDFDVPEGDPDAVRTALASLHADWRRTMTHLEDALRTSSTRSKQLRRNRRTSRPAWTRSILRSIGLGR